VDGTGLEPCTVGAFGIYSVEPLGSAVVCFDVVQNVLNIHKYWIENLTNLLHWFGNTS
jgi:hypothetical protein